MPGDPYRNAGLWCLGIVLCLLALAILGSGCTPGSPLHQGNVGVFHPKPSKCVLIEDAYVSSGGHVWNLCIHPDHVNTPDAFTVHLTRYVKSEEGTWVYAPLDVDVEVFP